MALSEHPAERHRQIAGLFTDRVRGTRSWDAPSPVAGWTARDVVRHLVEWLPGLLASGADVDLPRGPSVDEDPVAAWQTHRDGVQAVLDDPETAHRKLTNPHIGSLPLDTAIDQFYTADVFMHTWDLSRATGQDDRLDPGFCARLLAGMEEIEQVLRSSGQYGARIRVPDDADVQTRLLGFIGRNPFWPEPVSRTS
ncbi:TIGR03086 family metal-binding protein [Streptosporangium sandarakinum]|uniref:TIGR03086 family metal-binding protein n=1 Tax=Streptosporangium TaxID=2000 RepID=UPI0031F8D479